MNYSGFISDDDIEVVTEEDIINHRLIPVTISYDNKQNIWSFNPNSSDNYGHGSFRSSDYGLKLLLRRIKAKDSIVMPPSKKKVTYQSIIDNIKLGKYSTIYCWKLKIPLSLEEIKALVNK